MIQLDIKKFFIFHPVDVVKKIMLLVSLERV